MKLKGILNCLAFMASVAFMTNNGEAAMNLPSSFRYFDLEMPMRCSVDNFHEQNLSQYIPIQPQDFTVRLPHQTDLLPRYQVNGFSFKKKALDEALVELLEEAEIEVASELEVCPVLSASELTGELSAVVEKLANQAGVFYTYDAQKKLLTLKGKTPAVLQLPADKSIIMALVDALEGASIHPITPDWLNHQITLNVSRDELDRVRSLMAAMIKDKYLLTAQMSVYEVQFNSPKTHWQQVVSDFGTERVASSVPGISGNLMVFNPSVDAYQFVSKAMNYASVKPLAQGQIVVPSQWQVRFNFGECMMFPPYQDMSVRLTTKMRNKTQTDTKFIVDSQEGEVAAFDFASAMNQEVSAIGIPVPGKPNSELLFILRFNFINLTK